MPPFGERSKIGELYGRTQCLANALEQQGNDYHKAARKVAAQLSLILNDKEAREACDKKLNHEAGLARMIGASKSDSIFF